MFLRTKASGQYRYLQIVENRREGKRVRQRVIGTLGRVDELVESGGLDAFLESASRFSERLMVLSDHRRGRAPVVRSQKIGPAMIFERLWKQTGIQAALQRPLLDRRFEFQVERAIFLEVLHRLADPGSDRAGYAWRDGHAIEDAEDLQLHHAYRAMAWLGEPIEDQAHATPFASRCVKDVIEEELFERRRDLFSSLEIVFFDTTSIYFEGEGGEDIGRRGHSKDARPDLKQMIVGVVINEAGQPICCEMWPGNTADVSSLIPIVERLDRRFGIQRICIVADRGMIQKKTLDELEERGWPYILGARMRSQKEVRDEVLSRAGRYRKVTDAEGEPTELGVKEVWIDERRYIVCRNEAQARKDAADREAILASLEDRLRGGPKALVGNKGYRKYLKSSGESFSIDEAKARTEARFDGKWVLRTNTDLDAVEVAQKYKQLWTVEAVFRSMKSLLATRPVYHRTDEAIRGHVFCSFLALVLRKELCERLEKAESVQPEWQDVLRDLDRLEQVDVTSNDGKVFRLRTESAGCAGKVFRAVGVALPPTIQALPPPTPTEPAGEGECSAKTSMPTHKSHVIN